jgi:teichuronic acid biosynthesis glycosyltransferase TuaH
VRPVFRLAVSVEPDSELSAKTDLVFTFSFETWADAVRRELSFPLDRLVVGAANDSRVGRLLVADPWRSAPIALLRRIQGRRPEPFPPRHEPTRLVSPLRLRRQDPAGVNSLVRGYRGYDEQLERAALALGLESPAIITGNPFLAGFVDLSWAGPVTYYGWDDWTGSPSHERWWPALEAAYRGIHDRGRRVAAVSQTIIDRIDPAGSAAVVPNAVAPDEWEPPWDLPAWSAEVARPMILYVGSLGQRLDVSMLKATAARIPHGEVVLVGFVADPQALAPLADVPNVRIEGLIRRRQVAGLVHEADVCIMPHRRTRLTEAMSPLKLYEYLAAGRPVVVTDLPPVRQVDPRVILVPEGDSEGFAAGVLRALALGPASEEARHQFILENCWDRRLDQLLELALDSQCA